MTEGFMGQEINVDKGIKTIKQYYVYIMASKSKTLYTGITDDLVKRVFEHKNKLIKGFTKKYSVHLLVYFEEFNDIDTAITREKRLKKWKRAWKLKLMESLNPEWNDLYKEFV